jgi:protoporphyrinogen oxidase
MNRKQFIQWAVTFTGISCLFASCKPKKKIKGGIVGASANIGHLLRDKGFEEPLHISKQQTVIIGAGISGLSAAYQLRKWGIDDFIVLDLEAADGGNSVCSANAVSAYPWGAHYVPIPNNSLKEYLEFLGEAGVVTGMSNEGLPIYNEYHLCFDPEERLYINGRWQEGLIPHFGVPGNDKKEIGTFLATMNRYRYQTGVDGKDAFAIPANASSKDTALVQLDTITMKQWMQKKGFKSPYLHWYVDYCTRDDFGTPYDKVSAWAGIHYFAGRKGKGANATHSDVLTWPEGNGFLVRALQTSFAAKVQTNSLAVSVAVVDEGVTIDYYDVQSQKLKRIEAAQCIMAVPQFVASRLLKDERRKAFVQQHLKYVPWMVANLTVTNLEERSGAPLSWDNVIYESKSLGYVEATHQGITQSKPKKNLTYYLPLTDGEVGIDRKTAQHRSYEEWVEIIFADLKKVHPDIEAATEEINVMIWGHAMAQPLPGVIHGNARLQLGQSMNDRVHFAHTDLAGVSVFEEGFYQGLEAAKKVRDNLLLSAAQCRQTAINEQHD